MFFRVASRSLLELPESWKLSGSRAWYSGWRTGKEGTRPRGDHINGATTRVALTEIQYENPTRTHGKTQRHTKVSHALIHKRINTTVFWPNPGRGDPGGRPVAESG